MSQYQYLEWVCLDRALTTAEQSAVNALSSHITVMPMGAWVEYHWSSFKHDPLDVLARYFDGFLYMTEWDDLQLAFRIPAKLLDPWPLQPYIVDDYLDLRTVGAHHILSFRLPEVEPSGNWVDPQGWLGRLAPLRAEIMAGDYRALYLAWLCFAYLDQGYEIAHDEPEPPVPAGLAQLTPPQKALVAWFGMDPHLIDAAAQASPPWAPAPTVDLAAALGLLSRQECEAFLHRLLQDEALLAVALRRRLEELSDLPPVQQPGQPQRRVEELLALHAELVETARQQRAAAKRQQRLQELDALVGLEAELWQEVSRLLEGYQSANYDQAVAILVNLRDLARHTDDLPTFQARLDTLTEHYRRRTGLLRRLSGQGLV